MADMTAVSAGTATNPEHLLPPGFRFHPTDEELILHYLRNRASALPIPVSIIAEVDIYKFDPWELPAKAVFGDREWYFFSPRDRKYPNGVRPNRAAGSGYWKATGTDKPILLTSTTAGKRESIGVKKALVFYTGKPPKGNKTNWIMHEYRLPESAGRNNTPAVARRLFEQHQQFFSGNANDKPAQLQSKDSSSSSCMRLDDWVLCRIYEKTYNNNNNNTHSTSHRQHSAGSTLEPDRCADGDLDMEESSNNYIPCPFVQQATDTSPSPATLSSYHHQQPQQLEQEPDHFYRSLPKAASLSDLLAETDLSIVSRLLYDTPMPPPPPDVAASQPPQHLTADPPATASHQRINLHSVNAVAAPNLTQTNNKRQMLRPGTGSLLQQLIESKKPRHATSCFTGLQVTRPSAYDNIMNGCTTFAPSTCNLTDASAGFVNTTTGAHPLLSDVVPHPPQFTMMTTNGTNNASTTNQQYMMSSLHQPHLQMQFLNADYNGSVKLH